MSRIRLFILVMVSFLLGSAAFADDLGYVDCTSHPDTTPVFAKARQTPDSLGTVACGERFSVLVYGFVFSRVQTKEGKVGYVYSNLITVDRGGAAVARGTAAPAPAPPAAAAQPSSVAKMDSPPVTTSPAPEKPAAEPGPLFPTPPMPALTAADRASASAKSAPAGSAPAQPSSSPAPTANATAASIQVATSASQPVAASPAPADVSSRSAKPSSAPSPSVTPSASGSAPASASAASLSAPAPAPSAQPAAPAPASAETQPAASSTPAQSSAPAQPGPLFPTPPPQPASPASDTSSASAPAAADPAPAAASQPEAAQPAPEPVRRASSRSTWEQPTAGVHQSFLVQLYGGYAFDRFTSAGAATNLSGGMGAFGYNVKPWLQIVGDSSYSYVTGTGVKNVLYGNHFGARYFYHPGRWRVIPFAEALVGGSRYDITVSGPGGYKASQNCISYKAGGGLDFRVSRRWEVRVIDVDYYRTSFGSGSYPSQTNYWASAGVVLRLFGSGASE